jgi:hypothetical protein
MGNGKFETKRGQQECKNEKESMEQKEQTTSEEKGQKWGLKAKHVKMQLS